MKALALLLQAKGKTCWLDVNMAKPDTAAMEQGIKQSKCVIVFMTGDKRANGHSHTNIYSRARACGLCRIHAGALGGGVRRQFGRVWR